MEIWKDINGYEGLYQVSNFGNVRSLDRYVIGKDGVEKHFKGKMMAKTKGTDGYCLVRLSKDCIAKTYKIHRLVMTTFKPLDDYTDMEVNHIDCDRTNNRLDNLEWTTHIDNVRHSSKKGHYSKYKGSKYPKSNFTDEQIKIIRTMYKMGWSISQIVFEIYQITSSDNRMEYSRKYALISNIVRYKTWKHIA